MILKVFLSALTLTALAVALWFSVPGPGSEEAERRALVAQQLDPGGKNTPRQHAREVLLRHWEELAKHPHVLDLAFSLDTGELWITTDRPAVIPKAIEGVPVITAPAPPDLMVPGVWVMRPDGAEEYLKDAMQCPPGYKRTWHERRFCYRPVAGAPYRKAELILTLYGDELCALPRVGWAILSEEGIVLYTFCPQLVPQALEGIPIIARIPSTQCVTLLPGAGAQKWEQMDRFTGRRRWVTGELPCRGCQAFTTEVPGALCNAP